MSGSKLIRLRAIVHGKVQGVSFRYFVLESVRGKNITGWVRNRFSGTVEVLAEGTQEELEALILKLHQGPISSHVTKVETKWETATGEFKSFKIRMTR